jgi:hypothetical protein
MHVAREPPQRNRLGGQPRPVEMIGAPSRQPAVDRLVPPCGWDDGVVGLLQADSSSTTLMSETFNVERNPQETATAPGWESEPGALPGDQTGVRQLGVAFGGSRKTTL